MKEKILLFIAIVSSSVYFTAFYNHQNEQQKMTEEVPLNLEQLQGLQPDETNNIQVYNMTAKSVVNVASIRQRYSFYGTLNEPGGGSGFIWDDQGHIVTNYHVVQGADLITVKLHNDEKFYEAKVVGTAQRKDIAVLKINAPKEKLIPLKKGSSANLLVGQKTLAVGNPFGLDHTLTTGIISALDRKINGIGGVEIHGIIQTDASINPGNSGGPLLNSKGELIGMNTAIISNSGSSAGLGFAVPADTINEIVPQLIEFGREIRPTLGVNTIRSANLRQGVAIYSVTGAAEKAGLKGIQVDRWGRAYYGDIITAIDNNKINSNNELYHCISKYKIGDIVEVHIIRDGKEMSFKIKLESN